MPMPMSWKLCVLVLVVAAAVVGCDSAGEQGAPAAPGAQGKRQLSGEAAKLAATMVKAVGAPDANAPVDVRFEVAQRPEVGKPVDIAVVLVPNVKLERLYARFLPGEGLELIKGEQTDQMARPAVGTPIQHTITVVARRDGIFTVSAVLLTDSESESVSRTFSIPVIAGTGLPEWAPKQAGTGAGAAGQHGSLP